VEKLFPPKFTPYPGQLEALESIQTAFKQGKHFFVLEGPTGFGKSAVAKAVLNLYGKGFITSPLNTLVSQYSRDENLDLTEVRGQSGYVCTVFGGVDCEKASDRFKDHSERCMDYVPARDAFWTIPHSVTNVHFLYYAPPIDGAIYPREVLVIDEAHNLERTLVEIERRQITPKQVNAIGARPFEFVGEDRKQLDPSAVKQWLRYFESAIARSVGGLSDKAEKRGYESLQEAINFTLNCGDWIAWKEKGNLVVTPMSARKAASRLFRCAKRVLFMSATMGNVPLFLENLGIDTKDAGVHKAKCTFAPANRRIIYRDLGAMSKTSGQPGLTRMLEECSRILRERPHERGIIHCNSNELQRTVWGHLRKEFGIRILNHRHGADRDAGVGRLRASRNGVLCAVAMTEGLDLPDDEARFCIFAKIPWLDFTDPYVAERKKRSSDWYENVTALAVVQGSGRVVRNKTDHAETFIFDSSFRRLVHRFPDWWREALELVPSGPPRKSPFSFIVCDHREKRRS